jgi:hypothetical protein
VVIPTHVLEWIPGWMCGAARDGEWQLVTWAGFCRRTFTDGSWSNAGLPRDAFRAELERWAGEELGHSVIVIAGEQTVRSPRRFGFGWHDVREPIYYVRPVARRSP